MSFSIVSRSPPSRTPITGLPAAMDSTGEIPKILVHRQVDGRDGSAYEVFELLIADPAPELDIRGVPGHLLQTLQVTPPDATTSFLSGIARKASTIFSTLFNGKAVDR